LPQVTAVQTWKEIAVIGERENFAPSILKLRDGTYRIYWNSVRENGVTSASSRDGIAFTKDSGVRLKSGAAGEKDCIASHPWVVAMGNGYRMYYQGDAKCQRAQNEQPEFRVLSAFSSDGLNFTKEGVRVEIGANGLTQAAHGRVLRMDDGTYRMWFSANFAGKNAPADILGASSKDGLTWTLDAKPTLERAHDPTVTKLGGKIYIYTTFLGDNFVILESFDGFNFTPTSWVDFYDKNGKRYEEFGDVDILQLADGRLLMYGSGKGSPGVSAMEKSTTQTQQPPSGTAQPKQPPSETGQPPQPPGARPTADPTQFAQVKLTLTGKYLMAFHACDTAKTDCFNPRNHQVYLAQGNDGKNWSIVPGWQAYGGSVPDVIRRGNTIYIYTPGQVARYNIETRVFDPPRSVEISGSTMFVDPSFFVDEQGRLVMFFLHGKTGGDPAGCLPGEVTCTQRFGSATEVAGSNGTQFTLDAGDRATIELSSAGKMRSASDPDIFFDGKQYVLYISHGPSLSLWTSAALRGTYKQNTTFPDGLFVQSGASGVGAGHYDAATKQYWTYGHRPSGAQAMMIYRAVHSDFSRQLGPNDFAPVMTGSMLGLSATTNVESPGFAVNAP
jgi:hypothetical protein